MHLPHLRPFQDQPLVFFTVCTSQRRQILASATAHAILRKVWAESKERSGWWVGRYVLMPDHVHFFAMAAINSRPMARWMRIWKSVSSLEIKRAHSLEQPVWQADYFDRYLRTAESYSAKWTYVENNPVRAGLAGSAKDWPYQGVINDLAI